MGNFIDKLERKFGRYAVKNLMVYVSIINAIGFVIYKVNPMIYYQFLALDIEAILHGQIWRLLTFMMFPTHTNLLFFLISVMFYMSLGRDLENIWGSFRFNLYYFTGVLGTIIAGFIAYFIAGYSMFIGTQYLNMSIFLAFAVNIPDAQIVINFLFPVKAKWVAYFYALMMAVSFFEAFSIGSYGACISIVVAMLNFVLYFFAFMRRYHSPKQFIRRQQFKRAMNQGYRDGRGNAYPGGQSYGGQGNGQPYGGASYGGSQGSGQSYGYRGQGPVYGGPKGQNNGGKRITRHYCAICGRTELDGDDLEFRFCSKCNGNYEYCQDHLFTHTHVQ